ncbi:hypothetical protein BaRGS_00032470 [Batillaria attramentaria]|uniref:Uncharacterized protein n=1 Tax=Batillaria attramentaria TaxID=370345 RepID=A0ABD0JMY6_9CAEN|nr:hypothetical protein BaRGS_010538 [Batillaria attramentaria]KAG5691660.1 hypothetical protein BaRGS_022935 [Batillaria attramentaria]
MTTVTTREQAKQYLASHRIPQMFESLLSCLMMERPEDPVSFIEDKMSQIKQIGVKNVNWETFVISMHPYRDPVRRQYVRDGSKYDKEYEAEEQLVKDAQEQKAEQSKGDDYKPDVFELTEPSS